MRHRRPLADYSETIPAEGPGSARAGNHPPADPSPAEKRLWGEAEALGCARRTPGGLGRGLDGSHGTFVIFQVLDTSAICVTCPDGSYLFLRSPSPCASSMIDSQAPASASSAPPRGRHSCRTPRSGWRRRTAGVRHSSAPVHTHAMHLNLHWPRMGLSLRRLLVVRMPQAKKRRPWRTRSCR